MITIPANSITKSGESIKLETALLNQLNGRVIRRVFLETFTVEHEVKLAHIQFVFADGTTIRVTACGSVSLELLAL